MSRGNQQPRTQGHHYSDCRAAGSRNRRTRNGGTAEQCRKSSSSNTGTALTNSEGTVLTGTERNLSSHERRRAAWEIEVGIFRTQNPNRNENLQKTKNMSAVDQRGTSKSDSSKHEVMSERRRAAAWRIEIRIYRGIHHTELSASEENHHSRKQERPNCRTVWEIPQERQHCQAIWKIILMHRA